MGVELNTYVILGALIDYEEHEDRYDDFEPYIDSAFKGIEHKDGLCVIFDGMNGDYIFIGKVIAKTGLHVGFDEPIEVPNMLAEEVIHEAMTIADNIRNTFGIPVAHCEVKPWVVSHHT